MQCDFKVDEYSVDRVNNELTWLQELRNPYQYFSSDNSNDSSYGSNMNFFRETSVE